MQRGSPAEDSGLQPGDVVTEINGRPVRRSRDLRNALGVLAVGEEARMRVVRDGRERLVLARIGERSARTAEAGGLDRRLAGAVFSDIDEGSPLHGRIEGVLVTRVEAGSPAWRHGLRPGDVVLAVNRERVRALAELDEAVRAGGASLLLNIQRGRSSVLLIVR